MVLAQHAQVTGAIGVGYEGRDIDGFLASLLADDVTRLVDVRLTPISRKPGFSKTALGRALLGAGVAYEHRPQLGNPRHNRPGFAGTPEELARARENYAALLRDPEAARCLADLARAAANERVALLCFEADQDRCHRSVVLEELAALSA
nr:DUF488 domain-containing protein [Micromonospora sp. DSM 115978]